MKKTRFFYGLNYFLIVLLGWLLLFGKAAEMNKRSEESAKREQKEKKKGGAWKGIVAVILAAGVVGSTTISAFNLVTLKSYIAEQKKEEKRGKNLPLDVEPQS